MYNNFILWYKTVEWHREELNFFINIYQFKAKYKESVYKQYRNEIDVQHLFSSQSVMTKKS